jgi:hypothetical protein
VAAGLYVTRLRDASPGAGQRRGAMAGGDGPPEPKRLRRTASSPPPRASDSGDDDEPPRVPAPERHTAPARMTRIDGVPAMTVRSAALLVRRFASDCAGGSACRAGRKPAQVSACCCRFALPAMCAQIAARALRTET